MTYFLPQRRKRIRFGTRKETQVRSPGHLAWVRGHECCVAGKTGHVCTGRMEAHHDRQGTDGAASVKPGDDKAVPLCSGAHMEGDQHGWITFAKKYGIDLAKLAAELWRTSPHRLKYERTLSSPTGTR